MGIISSFFNQTAILYSIDRTSSTATGQPIETLVQPTTLKLYFSPKRSAHSMFPSGKVLVGEYVAISEKKMVTDQVLEIEGIKYKIIYCSEAKFQQRALAYVADLSLYKH